MDYSIFWNILAGILIFGGFLGALLPLLPGPPLAMAGLLIYAIAERFTSVSPWVVGALALLTLSTILVDVFAPVLAAKGYKASRLGVIGSFVGAIVGLWFGPLGIIVGPFVGAFEILCGTLVLAGLWTRLAAIPLLVVMAVAIMTTKWPMLADQGFWAMAHEARTDWSMTLGLVFLLIVGAGPWSLDAWLTDRRHPNL